MPLQITTDSFCPSGETIPIFSDFMTIMEILHINSLRTMKYSSIGEIFPHIGKIFSTMAFMSWNHAFFRFDPFDIDPPQKGKYTR